MEFGGTKMCSCCFGTERGITCPLCGYNKKKYKPAAFELPVGTSLNSRYQVGMVVGKGGFGITYKAYDRVEKRVVAVKEYFPNGIAHRNAGEKTVIISKSDLTEDFRVGAEKFLEEAKTVSRFNGNPNIVGIKDYFYTNETAYYVMEYLDGMDLKQYIKKAGGRLSQGQVLKITNIITDALLITHGMNVLHRDISPDNIFVLRNGNVKLIDFGAARQIMSIQSQSLSVILKQGFAPIEQYQRKGKQGTWTDIYALGATMYYALVGKVPDDAAERLEDPELGSCDKYVVDKGLWNIVKKAMEVNKEDRYQNILEIKEALRGLSIMEEELPFMEEAEAADYVRNGSGDVDTDAGGYVNSNSSAKSWTLTNSNPVVDDDDYKTVLLDESINNGDVVSDDVYLKEEVKDKKASIGHKGIVAVSILLILIVVVAFVMLNTGKNGNRNVANTAEGEDYADVEDLPGMPTEDVLRESERSESPEPDVGSVGIADSKSTDSNDKNSSTSEQLSSEDGDSKENEDEELSETESEEESEDPKEIIFPSPSKKRYDIRDGLKTECSDGIAYIKTAYFCLYFDEMDYSNNLWSWNTKGPKDAISFYYAGADGDENEGLVMTIRAYDLEDSTYKSFKDYEGYDYQIAGIGKNKRYVVLFKDNAYKADNAKKQKEYDSLVDYAHKIDSSKKGKKNNPFVCSKN